MMAKIRLEEGTIDHDGQWLTREDLAQKIQEKIAAGDYKITVMAAALEDLHTALENSHTLDIKLVLAKSDYERLKALGGGDDRECIRRAIMAFTAAKSNGPRPVAAKRTTIACSKCKKPIEVGSKQRPLEVECPHCGTSHLLEE